MKASAHVVVRRSPEEVFAFATNVRYFDRWVKGMSNPKWLDHAPNDKGGKFACRLAYGGVSSEVIFEIVSIRKKERYDIRIHDGPFGLLAKMAFEPVSGGTVVRRTVNLKLTPVPVPILETLGFVLRPMLAHRVREDLVRLKHCIEGTDPPMGTAVAPG